MRALLIACTIAAAGCADLSRPHPIRTSKESAIDGLPDGYVPPEQMVQIRDGSGRPLQVPRLDPSTRLPMRIGDKPAAMRRQP